MKNTIIILIAFVCGALATSFYHSLREKQAELVSDEMDIAEIINADTVAAYHNQSQSNFGTEKLKSIGLKTKSDSIKKISLVKAKLPQEMKDVNLSWYIKYEDFDKNGQCEMLAVADKYADREDEQSCRYVYYVNDKYRVLKLCDYYFPKIEPTAYYFSADYYDLQDEEGGLIYYNGLYEYGERTYCYYAYDEQLIAMGETPNFYVFNNKLLTFISEYDEILKDNTYYYYPLYFKDMEIFQYGGIDISLEELLQLNGSEEIVNNIEAKNGTIRSIYYRENGDVDINYTIREDLGDVRYFVPCVVNGKNISVNNNLIEYLAGDYSYYGGYCGPKDYAEFKDNIYGSPGFMQKTFPGVKSTYPPKFQY